MEKGNGPFVGLRVGAPSCVRPVGTLENAVLLARQVQDVELVFWDCPEGCNLPGTEEVSGLRRLGEEAGLSYTVHLPSEARLGSASEAERLGALDQCLRWMDLCRPLEPFAWVLHLCGDERGRIPSRDGARWQDRCSRSLEALCAAAERPRDLCAETLDYDFAWAGELVEEHGLGVCLDVGHLVAGGWDVEASLKRWLDRTKVLHLHGVRRGEDHVSLSWLAPEVRRQVWSALDRDPRPRVGTLEVFTPEDLEDSLRVLAADRAPRGSRKGGEDLDFS